MTTRFDLYSTVHKGLRAALFATTQLVGRTDFSQPGEAALVAAAVERLVGFLHEHADHEERVIALEIARCSAELAADLGADHARTQGLEQEVALLAERLGRATPGERRSLGRRIGERMAALTAEHLRHMEREEVQANRLLWANRTDDELIAIHARVVAAIPPARLAEWMELLLPAVSAPERALLLAGAAT